MVGAFDGLQDKCDLGPQQVAMLLKHLAKPVFLMGREFFTGKKGLFGLLIQFQERSVGLVINHVQVKVDLEGSWGMPLLSVLALTKLHVFGGSCYSVVGRNALDVRVGCFPWIVAVDRGRQQHLFFFVVRAYFFFFVVVGDGKSDSGSVVWIVAVVVIVVARIVVVDRGRHRHRHPFFFVVRVAHINGVLCAFAFCSVVCGGGFWRDACMLVVCCGVAGRNALDICAGRCFDLDIRIFVFLLMLLSSQ